MIEDYLSYDKESGNLYWKKDRSNVIKAGNIAGSKNTHGYIKIVFKNKQYYAHRIVWYLHKGEWPKSTIDHINGDRSDNRIENLRDVPKKINHRNMKQRSDNSSGCCGVYFHKQCNKWNPYIKISNRRYSLGLYDDWFDAVCARKSAEHKYGYHKNHGRIQSA